MRVSFKKILAEGENLPVTHGVAWFDYSSYQTICFPVPLNWIFRWIRRIWIFLQGNRRRKERDREIAEAAYVKAYQEAMRTIEYTVNDKFSVLLKKIDE